jgi:hypothetical protein
MHTGSEDVRQRVLNALHWDLAVPRDRLQVEVEEGWVTVHGIVDFPYQKSCAEADALGVPGVLGVKNRIRVQRSDPVSAGEPEHPLGQEDFWMTPAAHADPVGRVPR